MREPPGANHAPRRTGRRRGPSRTRTAIIDAARSAFATAGYDSVSIRSIARRAGVDAALVHRFFGSKESLFMAAMSFPVKPSELVPALLAGGSDRLGERVVTAILTLNDAVGAGAPFATLLRAAASNEQAARMVREFLVAEVLGRVACAAAPDQPELRATLAGSQIMGLVAARYIVRIPHAASAEPAYLAACVGPTIQRYLTGPLPPGATD